MFDDVNHGVALLDWFDTVPSHDTEGHCVCDTSVARHHAEKLVAALTKVSDSRDALIECLHNVWLLARAGRIDEALSTARYRLASHDRLQGEDAENTLVAQLRAEVETPPAEDHEEAEARTPPAPATSGPAGEGGAQERNPCIGCRIHGDCPLTWEDNDEAPRPEAWRPPCWKTPRTPPAEAPLRRRRELGAALLEALGRAMGDARHHAEALIAERDSAQDGLTDWCRRAEEWQAEADKRRVERDAERKAREKAEERCEKALALVTPATATHPKRLGHCNLCEIAAALADEPPTGDKTP
jgi:hypothetical protein